MTKKKYFPNNWKKIKSVPAEYFDHELTIEEFMDWRVDQWEIPSSVAAIIREENSVTGLITEYTYQQPSAAKKKMREIMDKGHEFLIANSEQVKLMQPHWEDEIDDEE
tara:strand:+ start:452 stop:775 length:324 start_codon:yes stop_codon:yes gene_type:complete